MQRLSAGALGLAFGILWSLGVLAVALGHHVRPTYGSEWLAALASVYPGLSATPTGIVIGLLWGFVDGVICGVLVAWLYNGLLPRALKDEPAPAAPKPAE